MSQHQACFARHPVGVLAINDGLSEPFDAGDLDAALAVHAVTAAVLPSMGVCEVCGAGACDHRADTQSRAEAALRDLAGRYSSVVVAGAGSAAPLALLLAARHRTLVRGCVLVRPRLGTGAPPESWLERILRRLAWPRCVLVGAVPDATPRPADESGASIASLGGRLRTIAQPALIIHARGRRCDELDDAWLLQRELGGMVEMVSVGPGGEGWRSVLGEVGLTRLARFVGRLAAEDRSQPRAAVVATAEPPGARGPVELRPQHA